jgi:hypothetical protein
MSEGRDDQMKWTETAAPDAMKERGLRSP